VSAGSTELVVGRIESAQDLIGGRGPSYQLRVDLGPRGILDCPIYVGASYGDRGALVGRQVLCALEDGEARVLFAQSHGHGPVLIQPEYEVENGTIIA
jgi:hypothetical protein